MSSSVCRLVADDGVLVCNAVGVSVQYGEVDAFFEWLKEPAPAPAPTQESIAPIQLHGETPAFEMSVVDEKLLAEAKQMELSPLDSCHFQVTTHTLYGIFKEFHN